MKEVATTTNIITVTAAAVDGTQEYIITPIYNDVILPTAEFTNGYIITPANQYIITPIGNNVVAPAMEAREFLIAMGIDSRYGHGASQTIKDPVVWETAAMETDFMLSLPLDLIGGACNSGGNAEAERGLCRSKGGYHDWWTSWYNRKNTSDGGSRLGS